MRWCRLLILTLGFHSYATLACTSDLVVQGEGLGGLPIQEEIQVCGKTKAAVFLRLIHNYDSRSVELTREKYEPYWQAIRKTFDEVPQFPLGRGECRHVVTVTAHWDGVDHSFSSCQNSPRSLLVHKMLDLMRTLFAEPGPTLN